MPDWKSTNELELDQLVFLNFTLCVLGVYFWDLVMTIPFEWRLVTGKLKWRWNMLLIELSRAAACINIVCVFMNNYAPSVHCTAMNRLLIVAIGIIFWCAVLIFGLRCAAVWQFNRFILALVAAAFINQFICVIAILAKSNAKYRPYADGCWSTDSNAWLPYMLFSQLVIDVTWLVLTTYKLRVDAKESTLGTIIVRDGVYYFIAAVVANCLDLLFYMTNWNSVMRFIFDLPTCLIVSVASTRVAMSLYMKDYRGIVTERSYWTGRSPATLPTSGAGAGGSTSKPKFGSPFVRYHAHSVSQQSTAIGSPVGQDSAVHHPHQTKSNLSDSADFHLHDDDDLGDRSHHHPGSHTALDLGRAI